LHRFGHPRFTKALPTCLLAARQPEASPTHHTRPRGRARRKTAFKKGSVIVALGRETTEIPRGPHSRSVIRCFTVLYLSAPGSPTLQVTLYGPRLLSSCIRPVPVASTQAGGSTSGYTGHPCAARPSHSHSQPRPRARTFYFPARFPGSQVRST